MKQQNDLNITITFKEDEEYSIRHFLNFWNAQHLARLTNPANQEMIKEWEENWQEYLKGRKL